MIKKEIMLENVEKDIENLTSQEQLKLLEKIANLLRKTYPSEKKSVDWSRLYGLGKGLWFGEDAQEYVHRLREERR